jgi:hypothetical protein
LLLYLLLLALGLLHALHERLMGLSLQTRLVLHLQPSQPIHSSADEFILNLLMTRRFLDHGPQEIDLVQNRVTLGVWRPEEEVQAWEGLMGVLWNPFTLLVNE